MNLVSPPPNAVNFRRAVVCGLLAVAMILCGCGGSISEVVAQNPRAKGGGGNPFTQRVDVDEFPRDLEWLNTGPLKKKDLHGKFVLLDFWTYCCINCMHILPELKKLEEKYPNELVVIGVHSAKFEEEKNTDNIREAILRYEIAHPVINDKDHKVWDNFGVSSWPTILMLDPEGKAVWGRSGEFKAAEVEAVLKTAIPYYTKAGLMNKAPVAFQLETHKVKDTPLRFPGKVLADAPSDRLFIADSNHNRIVISTLAGKLIDTIGLGAIGHRDGDFHTATFNHPQGMALHGETLYVADTENHMLRKVDLAKKLVTTIAGDGEQSPVAHGGKPKRTQLNSPWDLWIHDDDLYIAMAGPHQIWRMPLGESVIGPFAGNGREDIVDGPLLASKPYQLGFASFAQPSGLTSDGTWLYVADSEGSSIRAVPFRPLGEVKTVVGTSELPTGRLFHFGDVDGPRDRVKLQHCLAVAYDDGKLYVADTYNNKIKKVDPKTGATKTFAGTGEPGSSDGAKPTFDEPAGLSIADGKLYVADTNNHAIRVVDLSTAAVTTLTIEGLETSTGKADIKPDFADAAQVELKPATLKAKNGKVELEVSLELPAGWKINPLAKPSYWIDSPDKEGVVDRGAFGRTKLAEPSDGWVIELPVNRTGTDTIHVGTNYYYCEEGEDGVCKTGAVVFTLPLTISDDADSSDVALHYAIKDVEK